MNERLQAHDNRPLAVVKFGGLCLTDEAGRLSYENVDEYAAGLASVQDRFKLVVVSSGSVALGMSMWQELHGDNAPQPSLQSAATLGSAKAATVWQDSLEKHGVLAGQVMVTHHELADRDAKESKLLKKVLRENIFRNIISIMNENDATSDQELMMLRVGGDNDGIAGHVVHLMRANILCLMTHEVEGLEDDDENVIKEVGPEDIVGINNMLERQREREELRNETKKEGITRGGIPTKVQAAYSAASGGTKAYIANAHRPLAEVLDGQHGTFFRPHC